MTSPTRPDIEFIPLSSDPERIRFFGTLMPAILLLKRSPWQFLRYRVAGWRVPPVSVEALIAVEADDAAQVDDLWVFVHRWASPSFDPFAFARAKVFLQRVARLVERAGYRAEPVDALSPDVNLPRLAVRAGLGDPSPYGLLVHPLYGPRLILTALRTDHPLRPRPRWGGRGCTDCMLCVRECPQDPAEHGLIRLGQCQRCTRCLTVCPVGMGKARSSRGTRPSGTPKPSKSFRGRPSLAD